MEGRCEPAVEEGQWWEAGVGVEGSRATTPLHAGAVHQVAVVEVGGGPGADGGVHPVLLR